MHFLAGLFSLSSLETAIYFVGILSVLIVAHEWGHFIAARMCGMKVEEFALFFGKRLIRLGESKGTEYNIRSIPLGGYVRIAGMEMDEKLDTPVFPKLNNQPAGPVLNGLTGEMIEGIDFNAVSPEVLRAVKDSVNADCEISGYSQATLSSMITDENRTPEDIKYLKTIVNIPPYSPDPASFNQKPRWQRALVIFAGPLASVAFGALLFMSIGFTFGLPSENLTNQIQATVPNQPAQKAGLKAGDRIVQINGVAIPNESGNQLVGIIRSSIGKPLQLTILRGKSEFITVATPISVPTQEIVKGKVVTVQEGRLGFMPELDGTCVRVSVMHSIKRGLGMMRNIFTSIESIVAKHGIGDVVGGPVAIADAIHQQQSEGGAALMFIAAELSVSLGIMNLLPIPILDGGHLMLISWEALRKKRLTSMELYRAQIVGLSVIMTLVVLVMGHDVFRIFRH